MSDFVGGFFLGLGVAGVAGLLMLIEQIKSFRRCLDRGVIVDGDTVYAVRPGRIVKREELREKSKRDDPATRPCFAGSTICGSAAH